jgi:hypothetical protein
LLEKEENAVKIELKPDGDYLVGKYNSKRFGCELDVEALIGDGISEEYMQRCVDAAENFSDDMMNEINEAAKRYALAFIELCKEAVGDDFSFEDEDLPVITEDTPASEAAQYYRISALYPDAPKDGAELYFRFSGGCDWEIEHGFEAVFRDGKLVYLGSYDDVTPSRLDYYISREGREFNYALVQ